MAERILQALASAQSSHVACDDGDRQLTVRQFQQQVGQEAQWLAANRVRGCALLAENGIGWALSDVALLKLGALHVPVPHYFTAGQVQHVLDDARLDCMLTDQSERVLAQHAGWKLMAHSPHTALALLKRELPAPSAQQVAEGVSKITYTSGSTSQPKGVCLTAAVIEQVAVSLAGAIAQLDIRRHLSLLPLATLLENIAGIYVPLLLGATMNLRPGKAVGLSYAGVDAERILKTLTQTQPHSLVLVPELLRLLVGAAQRGWQAPESLKFMAVGGATVSVELLEQARLLGLPVYEGYGLSECASVVCLNTPAASRPGSVGKPLPHAQVRIDAQGQICIRGAVMSGYLGACEGTMDEVRSGDLGEFDADGFLYVRGRLKHMFISSMGRNVAPEWVERELTCEPVIAQAMVIGEALPYAVALVQPAANATREHIQQAVEAANARLPDYARVRRWARFPEALSHAAGLLTANGRLRREAILARYGALINPLCQPVADGDEMSFYDELIRGTVSDRNFLVSAPVVQRAVTEGLSRDTYIAFLTQAYHHVRHTVPLMRALATRLPPQHAWLSEEVTHYIEEELGHEQWILNDIAAAGGDAQSAAQCLPAPATDAMVAYAYDTIMRRNPLGFFGMVFVLEGTSVALALRAADQIQKSTGLPNRAMTYLRSHGQLDQEHIHHLAGILNRFEDAADRAAVSQCARTMFWLYGNVFRSLEAAADAASSDPLRRSA